MTAFTSLSISTADIVANQTINADTMKTRFDDIETSVGSLVGKAANVEEVNTFAKVQTFTETPIFNNGISLKSDSSKLISYVKNPVSDQDAATKKFVDDHLGWTKLGAGWTRPASGTNTWRPTYGSGLTQLEYAGYAFPESPIQLNFAGILGSTGVYQIMLGLTLNNTSLSDGNWISYSFGPINYGTDGQMINPDHYTTMFGSNTVFCRGEEDNKVTTCPVIILTSSDSKCYIRPNTYNASHTLDLWVMTYTKLS